MAKGVKASPLSDLFFPDDVMYAPTDLKKYGYRLKRGEPYRLYSATEVRELIKAGKVVKMAEAKPVIEKEVPAPANETPTVKQPRTEAEEEAFWEKHDRENGPLLIRHVLGFRDFEEPRAKYVKMRSKWVQANILPTKEDRERTRWLLQMYTVTLEWNDKKDRIDVVIHDKVHTTAPPPRVPSSIERKIREARARVRARKQG